MARFGVAWVRAAALAAITSCAGVCALPSLAVAAPIAFAAGHKGHYQIYTVEPSGTGLRQLTHSGSNQDPAISPNGRELLYVHSSGGRSAIYETKPTGGRTHDLTGMSHATYGHIAFSPSGRQIVVQYGAPYSPGFGLSLMSASGKAAKVVPGSAGDEDPAFTSSGRGLFYWTQTADDTEQGIFTVGLNGKHPRGVLVSGAYINDFSVSHGRIVYEQYSNTTGSACQRQIPGYYPGGTEVLAIANANGSHSTYLTGGQQCDNYEPAYSPDGNQIAFLSDRNGGSPPHAIYNLFVMSATGAGATQVTHFRSSLSQQPAW